MNELDYDGPVFKAKDLKTDDIVDYYDGNSTYTYRVVANTSDETLLERWNCSYNNTRKRVSHAQIDKAKFIHTGKVPGFFKRLFTDIDKF